MRRVRNTLAVLAFTTLFGCAVESPASTPTLEQIDLKLHNTHTTQPLTRDLTDMFMDERPEFHITVVSQSYSTLMNQLDNQQIDYFMSHYVPIRDDIWAAPMAQDGLLLIVHPDNPIATLSTDNIRDIFSGQLTNWSELEGTNNSIITLTYQDSDDLYHEFHRLVMGRQRISSTAQVVPTISSMIERVSTTPNAIGYIPFSYVDDNVRSVHIDGIIPSYDTLVENIYPLRTTIFVIGREEPPTIYRTFFSWVQHHEAQQSLQNRFIPLP